MGKSLWTWSHFKWWQLLDTFGTSSIQKHTSAMPVQRLGGIIVQEHRRLTGVLAHFVPRPVGNYRKRSVHVERHWISQFYKFRKKEWQTAVYCFRQYDIVSVIHFDWDIYKLQTTTTYSNRWCDNPSVTRQMFLFEYYSVVGTGYTQHNILVILCYN